MAKSKREDYYKTDQARKRLTKLREQLGKESQWLLLKAHSCGLSEKIDSAIVLIDWCLVELRRPNG
jgi:hypothetical protein